MPSEAQDPRDRGLAPPVTRAGRSAQLAKAATTSHNVNERRPRGRPRKDGSSNISELPVLPLQPLPSPPSVPSPCPKSRKKGRGRGRVQLEDEEHVDAEQHKTQETEVKEKTTGGRHSRRKSNSNPEPSQDQPKPEPELDPLPSHDHLKPQPDPGPAPSQDPPIPGHEVDPEPSHGHLKPEPDPAPSQDHPKPVHEMDPEPSHGHLKPESDPAPSQDHPKPVHEMDPEPSHGYSKPQPEPDPASRQDPPKPESDLDPKSIQDHQKPCHEMDPEQSHGHLKPQLEPDPASRQDPPKPESDLDPKPNQDHQKSGLEMDRKPSHDNLKPQPAPDPASCQDPSKPESELDPGDSHKHPKPELELDPEPSQDNQKSGHEMDREPSHDNLKTQPQPDPASCQDPPKPESDLDPGDSQDPPKPEPELDPEPSQEHLKPETQVDPESTQEGLKPELAPFQVSFSSNPEPIQDGSISQSEQDLNESCLECEHSKDHLGAQSQPTVCLHPETELNHGTSQASPRPDQEPSKDHSNPKVQTDPESGHNNLSPKPEPFPDHPSEESEFQDPSSELPPSPVESRGSYASHTLFLVFSSAEMSPFSPQPGSLDLSCNPVSMAIDCNKAAVSMETEGGGSSPTEQSPTFSPLASPCPRLDDEDSLSPLFHQTVSEDSGGSGPPILVHSKKFLKQCAFCYRGDNQAPLGQGHLMVFGPTPGYIPLHILNRRASSDCDNDCHDYCYGGSQTPSMCTSPEQCESSSEFVEQLGPIGLPHDLNIQSLFDPTGQCCAHLQCAAWSEGVCCGEGQSLLYVDKAIDSGSTQVCAYCQRLGASLRCYKANCGRSYHFPCAAAAGAQQNWTERHTLCTKHSVGVTLLCKLCLSGSDARSLLMCCCCGDCYHGDCLDPPVTPTPLCRAGWQCPQCRICQSCRLRGIEGTLLVCERCDKAYHTHCLTPPLDHRPSTGWSCKNCRICRRCGARSSGQWANHPFLCKSCDPALPCPVCDSSPDPYKSQETLTCICCYRCVHRDCAIGWQRERRVGPEDYICSTCKPKEGELIPYRPTQPPISLPKDPDHKDTTPPQFPPQFVSSEPPQHPIKLESASLPAESQCSLSLQQDPADPHIHPVPCQAESTEVHHGTALPTNVTEQSAQFQSQSKDIHYFQSPLSQDLLVQQHCFPPEVTQELHGSPPPSRHSPSDQLDHSSPPQPYNLEDNLVASHKDPVELQHTTSSESQYCPAASHRDPEEPHHSLFAKPQFDSEPPQPESKEPQHSPAAPEEDLTKSHHSPSPHPESQSPKNSHAPFHQDPVEPDNSDAPSHAELTEEHLQPPDKDPAELHQNPKSMEHTPGPHQSEHSAFLCSPASMHHLPTTEIQISPSQTQPDPPDLQCSPTSQLYPTNLLHSPEPKGLVDNIAQLHGDPTEFPNNPELMGLQYSPGPILAKTMASPQGISSSHSEPTELQVTVVSSHTNAEKKPDSTNHQGNDVGTNSSPSENPEGPSIALDQIIIQNQAEHSSDQLSHNSSSNTSNSIEDHCIATSSHSPVHESFMLCSDAHSPPSPIQLQQGSSNVQQTPPDTSCQQTLLQRPAQVCTSQLPSHPTGDSEPTLVQEKSESSSQVLLYTVFKLDRDSSTLCSRSTRTVIKQGSPKSFSAPCSPSPSQPPTKCSVSQPASPVHSQLKLGSSMFDVQSEGTFKCTSKSSQEMSLDCFAIQTGLADKSQTMEKVLASVSHVSNISPILTSDTDDRLSTNLTPAISGRLGTDHHSVAPVSPTLTLQSLIHTENSSCSPRPVEAIVPLPPQSACDSFIYCTEPNDIVKNRSVSYSPQHTNQMPTISIPSLPACALAVEPSPDTDESSRQSGLPDGSDVPPTSLYLFQTSNSEVASTDSLDHVSIVHSAARINDGLRDPVHDQERVIVTVCGSTEFTQTNVSPTCSGQYPSCAPSPNSPSHTSTFTGCRPLPSNHTLSHDDQATSSANISDTHLIQSPNRSCHAGQGNPLNVENMSINSPSGASSASTTQSSLAQTTADFESSPHSLAQSSKIYCGPHLNPVLNTENDSGPSSCLNADMDASLKVLNSDIGEMMPEPVKSSMYNKATLVSNSADNEHNTLNLCFTESQQSSGSSNPLHIKPIISVDISSSVAGTSPRSPVCCSPSQVNSSIHSCSHINEAPVCPQALSPHHETSSTATSLSPHREAGLSPHRETDSPAAGLSPHCETGSPAAVPSPHCETSSPAPGLSPHREIGSPAAGLCPHRETGLSPHPEADSPAVSLSPHPEADSPAVSLSPHCETGSPAAGLSPHRETGSPAAGLSPHRETGSPAAGLSPHRETGSPVAGLSPHRETSSPTPGLSPHCETGSPVAGLSPHHETSSPTPGLSPHCETGSPLTSPKCVPLQSNDIQVHPSPVSGHSEDTPGTGPDSPLLCFRATFTSLQQNIQTQMESAAAEYPNWADEEMSSEKKDEKTEVPPQEEQTESHSKEKHSSLSCSTEAQQELLPDAPFPALLAQPDPSFPALLSPCPLHGASSLDSCNSSSHKNASSSWCSPHTAPTPSPVDLHSKEEQLSTLTQPLEEASGETLPQNYESDSYKFTLEDDDDDDGDNDQAKPVAVETEPTTDETQSDSTPLEKGMKLLGTPAPTSSHTFTEEVPEVRHWMEEEELQDQSEAEEEEVPGSSVPELDPSLDDVMELMTSESPPSMLRHFSPPSPLFFFHRGEEQTVRPPPCSSRPSDDLSIRLRQSPFSTEASPETSPTRTPITPPPLSPASPHLDSSTDKFIPLSKATPTPLLPFTPKIGMGKPAISKRKFSPARARIKQGSCWNNRRAVSPPSSSQDSMGESGWDSPKPPPQDPPLWSMRVGRGSGFPGRRRSRGGGVGGGRGARGRSRLKTRDSLTVLPGSVNMEAFQPKEEEENSMHNTVVMFSTSDHFTLKQDMCVVCGSFGQGAEGRLLACSQCGQCYHPFCVNVKMTRVVLTKGWRCLECTVCETCGEASDPGRLLLCDDCDISYHTYCLDPPLHTVPKGAWKCKWCVRCIQCGSSSPGVRCDWQDNYSRCGPCGSLRCCPLCQKQYMHDELIMQCQQCDRWVHATCQGLACEDEVEALANEGFDCSLCRSHGCSSYGKCDNFSSPHMVQISSRLREPGIDSKTFTQDGVCLTELGLAQLQSLVEPLTSPRRYRRCKPKLKLRIINQNSVSVLQTPADPDTPTEQDHRGGLDCDLKSDSSPEREHGNNYDIAGEPEVTGGNKKRKRKPYRPGIGGFMVRQRGGKLGLSRIKLCTRDSSELLCRDEDVSMETTLTIDDTPGKVKKRYRKKKTKLEEVFPSYLQEAFFGKDLLDQSRQGGQRLRPGTLVQPIRSTNQLETITDEKRRPSPNTEADPTISNGALLDLSEVLITEPQILATGHAGHFQVERSPSPFAGLDLTSMADDASFTGSGGCGQRMAQEEPLDAILSPELDKMVTDGAILDKLYKIPELEGKDVEEVFTAVLRPNTSNNQLEQRQNTNSAAGNKTHTHQTATLAFPRIPLMNGRMGAVPHFSNTAVVSSGSQDPTGFRLGSAEGHAPGSVSDHIHGQPLTSQGSAGEGEQDVMSTAQKSMLKWEKEEALGDMATVAPVLYCNTNFPQLREQYPEWSTRVKQIAKLWRKACSQDRAPFVQKARDNRAAQRINKVQFSNDPIKRQQAIQPPLPVPYDPACVEMEGGFKDPLKSKESEQEQEWKLRQQMRQKSKQQAKMEASQKLEQVKNEQRQQLAAQRLSRPASPDNSSRSPMTPVMLGSVSPIHTPSSRESQFRHHLLQQGSSGQADDVFLKPQAPPPSGFPLPHSPHPSSPLHQPPSSPQMFSPPSSRPSSPWDTLKGGGTSRPISCQAGNLPGSQQQRRNSLSPSQGHDMFGSPAPSPDSKTSTDVSRNLISQPGLQQSRGGLINPASGSGSELLSRHLSLRPTEGFQCPQKSGTLRHSLDPSCRPGDPVQGNLFKAPMPPQQEVCGGAGGGGRKDPSRPTDVNIASLSQSQDSAFPSSPISALGSPQQSPYAQMPGTPRPEYNQQTTDPFMRQSPPYINPQITAGHRPSPSHQNTDPYSANPGTPRPPAVERFPRTPGSQQSGTPRPDQYSQQSPTVCTQKSPVDGSTPQHVGPGSSPLALQTFTSTQHQLSPGQHHLLDSFPRNTITQTQKHAGTLEASGLSGLAGQPNPNPFEQGPVVPGASQTDKTKSNEMESMDVGSLTGPVNMLPQQGDSEEKLRQRQRLRQLILRQQQQKNVSRQEKVLQDGAAGPSHHWLQKESTSASPADPFGRPPPPYPGTIRPAGAMTLRCPGNFTADQQRSSSDAAIPRQILPREQGVQGLVQRIVAPPGGLQGSFLRMSQGAGPGSRLAVEHGVSVQIKRPGEFAGIRPVNATGGHMMTGVCQPFLPRALPLQQHSIMGQPYIELRHRAPENRLRLPFPSSAELQARNIQVPPLSQQMVMQQHVASSVASSQNSEAALPGTEGIQDQLEGEDSAVKDLEDVEVKDLVDLNLNLDPEDGKEDLDLGPNDLHLDDILLSGKFDLIAYADPELNLEEKKDMFNEELELGEVAAEEKEVGARKADHLVKLEMQDCTAVAQHEGVNSCTNSCQSTTSIVLRKVEDSGSGTSAVPVFHTQVNPAPLGISSQAQPPSAEGQSRSYGPPSSTQSSVITSPTQGSLMSPHTSVTPQVMPLPPPQPHLPLSSQTQTPHMGTSTQVQTSNPTIFKQIHEHNQNKQRPLLLEEQPLLLQDLLDQERQEQQQQKQMQALIRQRSTPDSVITNMAEFDSISDPIMKAKMVALKGINKVMIQGNLSLNPMVINRLHPDPVAQGTLVTPVSEGTPQLVGQDEKLTSQLVHPNPPNFGSNFVNESQRRQYEEWLAETQRLLQMQQRLLEDQIITHRKTKKSLSAKQRTAKKAGRAFAEEDAAQLRHVTELQGTVQKQLEQIRKQQKNHTELIEDYRTKQQQRALQQPPTSSPPIMHQKLSQPVGGPTPSHTPNITASWASGSGAPGVFAQRVPPMALPDPPQPPSHRQTPGFPTGTQGPTGGPGGRPTPCQVNYDDNNPFSEGFQERERRERLREQQERERVQLLQEVELHQALEQRMELEQQALFGTPGVTGIAVTTLGGGSGGPASGLTPGPAGESLPQMPFFGSELPQDFLQTCPVSRPPQQNQSQTDFQQADANQGYCEGAQNPEALLTSGLRPRTTAEHDMSHLESRSSPRFLGTAGLPDPVQPAAVPLSHLEGKAHQFGHDFSSSPPPSHLPCLSGEPTTLLKRKKRNVDDNGARTPMSSHSDITASSTPSVLDSSYSGPTQALPSVTLPQKEQQEEGGACEGGRVKKEEGVAEEVLSPAVCGRSKDGDGSKELLRQLLKDKTSHIMTLPTNHTPPAAHRQSPNESILSEEEDRPCFQGNIDLLDSRNKMQHCKRLARPEKERLPPRNKRRKKEDEEITLCSSSAEPILTHLAQVSVLPLMEPVLGVDLSFFPPYGNTCLGRHSRLSGSFGNASLDGVTDFYSQLIYKNNLTNPPTPPASLPPTPPPAARQKLMNGFATTDELSRKDGMTQKGEGLVPLNHPNKTVDVPASLPTPPHNNQEELKVQVLSECETPDSYVRSSSPESVADMEISRFPDFSFIKLEPLSPCPSPILPIMPSATGKASAVKQEVKVEPNPQDHSSCSNTDLVTIAITVNPVAAQNIVGVMAAVAELLRVPVPVDYQLSRSTVTDHGSLALLAGVCMPLTRSSIESRQQRPSTAAGGTDVQHGNSAVRPQCCSYCKGMLEKGVQIRELKQEGQSRPGTSLVFCSPNCSSLYSSDLRRMTTGTKAAELMTVMSSKHAPPNRVQHKYTNNMSSIAVHSLLHMPSPRPITCSPPPHFPSASTITMETKTHMDSLKVTVKLKPHPRAVTGGDDMQFPHAKKMKSSRWKRWSISISSSRSITIPSVAIGMPNEEEVDLLLRKFEVCLRPDTLPKDQRRCCFCNQQGDGETDGPARLLNVDLDLWVHLNCALWSSEVYETQAGALINVELALRRGLTLRCAHCQQIGATSGCNRFRCTNTYHFTCALQASCTFFKDKTMLCHLHKPRTVSLSGEKSFSCSPSSNLGSVSDPSIIMTSDPYDSELRCFTVFRRVFVQRDEARQIAALVQRSERQHTFRVGSLLFRSVGRLLPQQMNMFHNNSAIFPIGYHANRIYWSMRHSNRRCKYMCYIEEKENQPLFKVKVVEKGQDDIVLTGPTPKAVWDQILAPISQMRSSNGTLKLFPVYLKGEDLFGLTTSAVTRIIESLPGVENCERYTFRYGRNPLMEWPLAFNPSGSARSEPKACQNKRPNLLTSIAPRCQGTVGSIVGLVPGVISLSPGESVAGAHQGRHSKSSQYRRMKAEWKSNVYLARSRIQGLGLYAARDIEKCTMVIEYIGTIIRSEVANRKERLYESQNRGVYMFRIDNDYVIDATITGGPARYINHSCSPNCITEVVTVEKENKIIISSCRRIQRGEELSYDYKFDLEDDQHKIPCHCGAVNCRKWMN